LSARTLAPAERSSVRGRTAPAAAARASCWKAVSTTACARRRRCARLHRESAGCPRTSSSPTRSPPAPTWRRG